MKMDKAPGTQTLAARHELRRYSDIRELIASQADPTPLVRANHVMPSAAFELCLKLEWFNPFGSIKDRTAAEHAGNNEGIAVAISPDSGFKYTSYFMDILGDEGNPQV